MGSCRALTALLLGWTAMPVHAADSRPQFNADGELSRPVEYRQWVFVSSSLGMTYGPARPEPGEQPHFSNVFVNPEAYEEFLNRGRWPDGTFFVLEVRRSEEGVAIDSRGRTQGARVALEASVKDRRRFPKSGWAYFDFDGREAAAPLPRSETCYTCHSEHGAVEWTFSQFYPDLFDRARRLGTVRDDYDPTRKFE